MPFVRVKSALTGHEFDVNPDHAAQNDDWTVIDKMPVESQRPPVYGDTPSGETPVVSKPLVRDDRLSKKSAE